MQFLVLLLEKKFCQYIENFVDGLECMVWRKVNEFQDMNQLLLIWRFIGSKYSNGFLKYMCFGGWQIDFFFFWRIGNGYILEEVKIIFWKGLGVGKVNIVVFLVLLFYCTSIYICERLYREMSILWGCLFVLSLDDQVIIMCIELK